MFRLLVAHLRHRPGRTVALFASILIAAASFATLTGASETSRLTVVGRLKQQSRRTLYDILVQPGHVTSGPIAGKGLLAPNFLAGEFGGITLGQLATIRHVPGVAVAAPIALVGYVLPTVDVPIRLAGTLGQGQRQLFRERIQWSSDRGLTHIQDADTYVYVTDKVMDPVQSYAVTDHAVPRAIERLSSDSAASVCPFDADPNVPASPFAPSVRGQILCWSRRTGLAGMAQTGSPDPDDLVGNLGGQVQWPVPLLVAAIDPNAEAKLLGLQHTVVSGRYLREGDAAESFSEAGEDIQAAPVLLPTDPYLDETAHVEIYRLKDAAGILGQRTPARLARFLNSRQNGPLVMSRSVTAQDAYRTLVSEARGHLDLNAYWTAGPVHQPRGADGTAIPARVSNPGDVWQNEQTDPFVDVPITASDDSFRALTESQTIFGKPPGSEFPGIHAVGTFDPQDIPGFADAAGQPLSPFQLPSATAANTRTARLLRGQTLLPDGNPAGYLPEPPLMLTTFAGLKVFYSSALFTGTAPVSAPISSIAVRVAGATGIGALSRERVRAVAQLISRRTHLRVDITAGSAGAKVPVDLPAGSHGRPALQLDTIWARQGVVVTILRAIDRESVLLFALILVVCALFVANASAAAVRARRRDFGILAATGWSAGSLFALVVGESVAIGALAGAAGALVSVPATLALGLHVSSVRLVLSVPIAMAVALVGGLWPAAWAALTPPALTIVTPASSAGSSRSARRVWSMALRYIVRMPVRSVISVLTMALAVGALTVLLSVIFGFHGSLVGSVLGSAIALQVRSVDIIAVSIMLLLGAAAIADVLFLAIRERANELATLAATGWSQGNLGWLIACEGISVGGLGALVGAAAGLAGASIFAGTVAGSTILVAVLAAAAGAVLSAMACVVPALLLRTLPMAELLGEE